MRRSGVAESSCLCGLDEGGNEAGGGRSAGSSELEPSSAMVAVAAELDAGETRMRVDWWSGSVVGA